MAVKIKIWNQRMLILLDYCKTNSIKGITTNNDFLQIIGDNSKGASLGPIREGRQSFQHEHFAKAAKVFNVSMEWFYGFTDTMKRNVNGESVEELLQQALIMMKSKK